MFSPRVLHGVPLCPELAPMFMPQVCEFQPSIGEIWKERRGGTLAQGSVLINGVKILFQQDGRLNTRPSSSGAQQPAWRRFSSAFCGRICSLPSNSLLLRLSPVHWSHGCKASDILTSQNCPHFRHQAQAQRCPGHVDPPLSRLQSWGTPRPSQVY